MNLFTEKEYSNQSQHLTYRLRNLYLKNKNDFTIIQDFLPFPIYINHRVSLNYEYFSNCFFSRGKEIENLYEKGGVYLKKISNPFLLENAKNKAREFHLKNDYQNVLNYLQIMTLNEKSTPFFTNKILINKNLTLNTTLFPLELEPLNKIFKELIPFGNEHYNKWIYFQTLTKREKEILKLLAKGFSNKEVSELLFISPHSVHTHRRNIYKKLEIKKTNELVRFAYQLDLLL